MSWSVLIAVLALLQGVGVFLDNHNLTSKQKDDVRVGLIKIFVFVDGKNFPNLIYKAVRFLFASSGGLGAAKLLLACLPPSTLSSFVLSLALAAVDDYDARHDISDDFLYLLLPMLAIHLLWLLSIRYLSRLLPEVDGAFKTFFRSTVIVALPCFSLVLILAILGLFFSTGEASDRLPSSLEIGFLLSIPIIFFSGILSLSLFLAFLVTTKLLVDLLRTSVMIVSDKASSPTTSPFTYLSFLSGVLILAIKLLAEVV